MEFNSVDKTIVGLLLRRGVLECYTLHEELGFSASQLARTIGHLTSVGMVEFFDDSMTLHLTQNARSAIFKFRHEIYNRRFAWRALPDHMTLVQHLQHRPGEHGGRQYLNFDKLGRDLQKKVIEEMERRARKHED